MARTLSLALLLAVLVPVARADEPPVVAPPPAGSSEADLLLRRARLSWELEDHDAAARDWQAAHEKDVEAFQRSRAAATSEEERRAMAAAVDPEAEPTDPWLQSRVQLGVGLWWNHHLEMDLALGRNVRRRPAREHDIAAIFGVSDLPVSEVVDANQNAVLELRVGYTSRHWGISLWGVPPYRYEGVRTLNTSIDLGDQTLEAGTTVGTELNFFHLGLDIEWHVVNNRTVRFSPQLSLRMVGLSWNFDVARTGFFGLQQRTRIESSDFFDIISMGEFEALPYPELGATLRIGDREWLECGLTLMGFYVSYLDVQGATLRIEADLTWWITHHIGVSLGWRSLFYDIRGQDEDHYAAFQASINGLTTGLTLQF